MSHPQQSPVPALAVLVSAPREDYELLDFGGGRKLERFGPYRVNRPEEQALGAPRLPPKAWEEADAVFDGDAEDKAGRWRFRAKAVEQFELCYKDLKFWGRFTPFRHMGFFPEQAVHWEWMRREIAAAPKPLRLLNLFGYTGLASLIAAQAGADVTHVDASKKAIAFARDNQKHAGLMKAPIRWICDDAVAFVARETRRGRVYDGIVLDPPKFGRGPEGEVWNLFADLPGHLAACAALLAPQARFLILTAYAIRASALCLEDLLSATMTARTGAVDSGELALATRQERLLSTSLFARWRAA